MFNIFISLVVCLSIFIFGESKLSVDAMEDALQVKIEKSKGVVGDYGDSSINNLINGEKGKNDRVSWAFAKSGINVKGEYFFNVKFAKKIKVLKVLLKKDRVGSVGQYKLQGKNDGGN